MKTDDLQAALAAAEQRGREQQRAAVAVLIEKRIKEYQRGSAYWGSNQDTPEGRARHYSYADMAQALIDLNRSLAALPLAVASPEGPEQ